MLTHFRQTRVRLWQLADAGLFVLALGIAYAVRARLAGPGLAELEDFDKYLWLVPVVAVLGPAVLASQGFYRQAVLASRLQAAAVVARSCVFSVLGLILFLFLVRGQFARSVVILVGGLGGGFVFGRAELVRWFERTTLAQDQLRRRVLWIGRTEENQRGAGRLSAAERESLVTVGEFDPGRVPLAELGRLLHEQSVNLAIIAAAGVPTAEIAAVLSVLRREGVEILLRPGLPLGGLGQLAFDELGGEVALSIRAQSAQRDSLALKQALDYLLGAALLVLLLPLLLALGLATKLTSPGPALYRQLRAGLNGRTFSMWKFRSMRAGAEGEQAGLAARNEMKGPVFKLAADPRVTPFGRFMRRHSLDELPQLWNVVRGEMSLVGPRPLPLGEIGRFADDAHRRRLSVKPGLTCLWQISGRNDIADFEDWVRLDLAYIDQWSLLLDFKILLATIPVALFGRGGR